MTDRLPRILLATSAAVLAFGGLVHGAAFNKAASDVAATNLPVFYANVLKAFWLMDSATLLLLAVVFGFVSARPVVAAGSVIMLLALIPAATAALLYTFIGLFTPAHVLLAAAAMAIVAGLLRKRG